MKLPTSTQMSKEQKDIYLNSPLDGNILISGPPGTGKTVIAFLRAQTLAKQQKNVSVIMFNNVLTSYTKNAAEEKFQVKTFNKWFHEWWNQLNIGEDDWDPDTFGRQVFLPRCAGFNKEKMKSIFGNLWVRFDGKYRKQWFTSIDNYNEHKIFTEYAKPLPEMPKADEFTPEWDGVLDKIIENKEKVLKDNSANWGHLIIDEGQDFSKAMYNTFYLLQEIIFDKSKSDNSVKKPALTVFADENQRIREQNSTLDDISEDLRIDKKRSYRLTYNYRNTLEIALLSSEFYVGLQTGIPKLPERRGEKPRLVRSRTYDQTIDFVIRYISNHENEEIGIFVHNHTARQKIIKSLKEKMPISTKVQIQSYQYQDPEYRDAKKLKFDKGGIVTVITKHSCKGLEFDSVFILELQEVDVDPSAIDQFKMEMYVMTSRARSNLFLMYTNEGDVDVQILNYLPTKERDLLELING